MPGPSFEHMPLAAFQQHSELTALARRQQAQAAELARDVAERQQEEAQHREERDVVQDETLAALLTLADLQKQADERQQEHERQRVEDARNARLREWTVIGLAALTLGATVAGIIINVS